MDEQSLSQWDNNPDSKVRGANMGPTRVLSAPDGPHVGPMNLAIREVFDLDARILRKNYANDMANTALDPCIAR